MNGTKSASALDTIMEKQTETLSFRAPQPIKEAWGRLTDDDKFELKYKLFKEIATRDNANRLDLSKYGLGE